MAGMIACTDVGVRTPGHSGSWILSDISMSVRAGEFVSIVGPSGAGKSTLLRCLSGMVVPDRGRVDLLGTSVRDPYGRKTSRIRAGRTGFIFQDYRLFEFMNVLDNVLVPRRLTRSRGGRERALTLLTHLGLADKAHQQVSELSGGEKQRVAVARCLINDPDIVFADEPTGALDEHSAHQVLSAVEDLVTERRAVVMVTHDLAVAARAHRVIVLRNGQTWQELSRPTADEVFTAVQSAAVR
ncbi:ABC transporter ATP-binding protein [Austwickia chelonae]|uniref:ABC transporter ATP-binding protein n=1 Tax=Austwickia chelonae TaxID=100225 RepID=UPI000E26E818|nr:ABC transporter ATP-binding protein [Austwickia chelonae]